MFAFSENILDINKINEKVSNKGSDVSQLTNLHSNMGGWISFIITVAILCVILFLLYRFVKRRSFTSSSDFLKVVDTLYLDTNNKLSIIKIGSEYHLIGYNSNTMVKIGEIEDESMIEQFKLDLRTTRSFKDVFLSKTTKNFTLQKAKDRLNKLK